MGRPYFSLSNSNNERKGSLTWPSIMGSSFALTLTIGAGTGAGRTDAPAPAGQGTLLEGMSGGEKPGD